MPQKKKEKNKKPFLDWLPEEYIQKYEATDLRYRFCAEVFSKVETNMRDEIPETTMRSWFLEFIKRGWTKEMVKRRYNGLISKPKYGAVDFSMWVNAVPVYGEDEFLIIVKQKIEAMITRAKYLIQNKDKITALTDEEKEAIEIVLAKETEFDIMNEKLRVVDEYKQKRREELRKEKKRKA